MYIAWHHVTNLSTQIICCFYYLLSFIIKSKKIGFGSLMEFFSFVLAI